MTHITGILVIFLLAFSAPSLADVRIHAKSSKTNADLIINPANGRPKDSTSSPSSVAAIDCFTIKSGHLFYKGQPTFKATEILAQSAADDTDIVVARVETLGLGNPLAFLAGHPKQVSKIVVAGFRDGRLVWQRRIAKEAYSGKWQASVSPPEA
jgi:hypothetical protein